MLLLEPDLPMEDVREFVKAFEDACGSTPRVDYSKTTEDGRYLCAWHYMATLMGAVRLML